MSMFWKYQFRQQKGSLSCLGLQGRVSKDVCEQQERMKTVQGDQLGGQSWWELRQQAATGAAEERGKASLSLHSMVGLQTSNERLSNPAVEEH